MKIRFPVLLLAASLSACSSVYVPKVVKVPVDTGVPVVPSVAFRLADSHWVDVSKIRDEAMRLSYQVSEGKITKVQAAQYLNRFRVNLVGNNQIDDDMYEVYLRSAVDSQRGAITTEQSKQFIENALRGWQLRWSYMKNKPANPAFTNFLMEHMKLQPLQ
ncbi:hypothetical protein [Stenoxybacter acetivorans]|uniref:hypothetical protein n=1 Tax=Stenoxybacter acetivorans TaxID=422441 RepID=UPI00055D4065|nr:hypothetical protein [Stenoxybacter acetivorans]